MIRLYLRCGLFLAGRLRRPRPRAGNASRSADPEGGSMSEEEKMKAFIRDLFDEFYPDCGDIDGGTLQDLAEKHGILVPEIRHEPCGEFCNCAQVCYDEEWQEGVKCYRLANWLSAEHGVHPTWGRLRNFWTGLFAPRR